MSDKQYPAAVEAEIRIRQEVADAARYLARLGFRGEKGDPLPLGISARAASRINSNPADFWWQVNEHRFRAWRARGRQCTCRTTYENEALAQKELLSHVTHWEANCPYR